MKRVLQVAGLAIAAIFAAAIIYFTIEVSEPHVGTTAKTVLSKDGTTIAIEQSGSGPAVILVAAALADHAGTAKLAEHLSTGFTVINYDRRGRGKSTDIQPYAVAREVEDIEALIDSTGGPAFVFGSSSGAVLALEAASRLGAKIPRLFLYEPPFILDNSHPPMPENFSRQIIDLVSANRRNDAVKLFFAKGMGIPDFIVTLMRWLMPGWAKMAAIAHTIPYDLAILEGTQSGKPLPADRWNRTTARTMVMVGSKSEPFFNGGAKSLAGILPKAEYKSLEGQDHSAILMASKSIADAAETFFKAK